MQISLHQYWHLNSLFCICVMWDFFHFSCYSTCNSELGTCACILVLKYLPQTVYVEWGCTTFSWFHCFTSFHNEDYLLTWITARGYLAQLVVSYHIWICILLGEKFGLYFIVNTYLDEINCFWHFTLYILQTHLMDLCFSGKFINTFFQLIWHVNCS